MSKFALSMPQKNIATEQKKIVIAATYVKKHVRSGCLLNPGRPCGLIIIVPELKFVLNLPYDDILAFFNNTHCAFLIQYNSITICIYLPPLFPNLIHINRTSPPRTWRWRGANYRLFVHTGSNAQTLYTIDPVFHGCMLRTCLCYCFWNGDILLEELGPLAKFIIH